MIYLIKSALLLTALYGCFALLLSRETYHRLNRLCLLSALVASLLLPIVQLSMKKPSFLNYEKISAPLFEERTESEDVVGATQSEGKSISTLQEVQPLIEETSPVSSYSINVSKVVWVLYLVGLLISLAILFVQIIRLWQEQKGGIHTKDEFGNTVIIRGGDFAPYSFLHYIIINVKDYEHLRQPILAHEQAHIRLGHTWDLLLLEAVKAVQWFNPFVYLLGRDLKAVHEYEADNAVLNLDIDAKTYQLLLVTKAVGNRLQTLANSLNHGSLKKRIIMMHKKNSNRWQMAKVAVLPVLMALALVAFAKPASASSDSSEGERTALPALEDNNEVQDAGPVTVAVPGMGLVMTDEVKGFSGKKMLNAFIPRADAKDFIKKHGPAIVVYWLKGTWVVRDEDSYIEEHPDCRYPWAFHTKYYKVMLDGKELDVNNLPNLPASALKKVEVSLKNHSVNLITKPVQIPAGIKGNIDPELTILLTGTPPKDSGTKTSIWERRGDFDGFSWKNYTICSWKWDVDDISVHLKEVAIRKDHSVRINVCKGVPQEHINRIKRLMNENGVTNYKFVHQ